MADNNPISCAICVRPITGDVRREPLGRHDALVPVCGRCATQVVTPVGLTTVPRSFRRPAASPRAVQIREHRDSLAARGICTNGEKHGAATHGRLCEACWSKGKAKERNRARNREVES